MWDGSAIGGSSFLNRGIAAAQTIGTDRFLAGQYWNSVGGQAARLIVPFVDSYANYRMGEPVSSVSLMMDTLSIIPFGSIAGGVSRSIKATSKLATNIIRSASEFRNASKVIYIGKVKDIEKLGLTEHSLLPELKNLGSPKANYYQNMSILRRKIREGYTIVDCSLFNPNVKKNSFLGAERNLMENLGYVVDPKSGVYYKP